MFKSKPRIMRRGLLGCRPILSFMYLSQVGKGKGEVVQISNIFFRPSKHGPDRTKHNSYRAETERHGGSQQVPNAVRTTSALLTPSLGKKYAWRHPCQATDA